MIIGKLLDTLGHDRFGGVSDLVVCLIVCIAWLFILGFRVWHSCVAF